MNIAATIRKSSRPRGMSVVEVLLSLAISSLLLVAVAVAFDASSKVISINERLFRATQAARISVSQITTELRNCQSGVVDDNSLELTTGAGQKRLYALNTAEHALSMSLLDQTPAPTYTLASNVASATFTTNGAAVTVTITVRIEEQSVTITGSALPRRTITYQ